MGKKHDETRDLRSIAKVAKVNYSNKSITISKDKAGLSIIGKLDYLSKCCGYHVMYTDAPVDSKSLILD